MLSNIISLILITIAMTGMPEGVRGAVEIPFSIHSSHIILDVELNGKVVPTVLDSGMPMAGILLTGEGDIHRFGLQYTAKVPVGGAGGGTVQADVAMGATIKFGDISLSDQMVVAMPEREKVRLHSEAVIGYSIFGNYTVLVDYVNRKLVLYEPGIYSPGSGFERIPLQLRNNFPFATYSITQEDGSVRELNTTVDMGASRAVMLYPAGPANVFVPEQNVPFRIGRGATHDIEGHFGRISKLQIGPYEFDQVLAAYQSGPLVGPAQMSPHGNLGAGILSRFDVVMDYADSCMFLRPNIRYNDPFAFNMVGLQVALSGNGDHFLVERVVAGSVAEEQGIKIGDMILGVNGRQASEIGEHDFQQMMQESEGTTMTLNLKRGEASSTMQFKLRRIL